MNRINELNAYRIELGRQLRAKQRELSRTDLPEKLLLQINIHCGRLRSDINAVTSLIAKLRKGGIDK